MEEARQKTSEESVRKDNANQSQKQSIFQVGITGDWGEDTYTRYMPGCLGPNEVETTPQDNPDPTLKDDHYYRIMAHDLSVAAGAKLIYNALKTLLPSDGKKALFNINPVGPWDKATMPQTLRFIKEYKWKAPNDKKVLRISNVQPLRKDSGLATSGDLKFKADAFKGLDCLVIHDSTTIWRDALSAKTAIHEFLKPEEVELQKPPEGEIQNPEKDAKKAVPRVIVNLCEHLPQLKLEGNQVTVNDKKNEMWQRLWDYGKQVVIVCSATSLRQAKAAISKRLSWEQTIEDIVADMSRHDILNCLSTFGHLIIRFGFSGMLYLKTTRVQEKEGEYIYNRDAQFVFLPNAKGGIFRDQVEDGRIVGRNSVIIACLLARMESDRKNFSGNTVTRALNDALRLNMKLFDSGFPCPSSAKFRSSSGRSRRHGGPVDKFLAAYFRGNGMNDSGTSEPLWKSLFPLDGCTDKVERDRVVANPQIDLKDIEASVSDQKKPRNWQILRTQIQGDGENPKKMSRINVGIAICRFGHTHVLNRDLTGGHEGRGSHCDITSQAVLKVLRVPECPPFGKIKDEEPLDIGMRITEVTADKNPAAKPSEARSIFAPVLEFGKLVVIERDEMESLRSIRNLIKAYQEGQMLPNHPMSIAVFGAPGSGKSFAVKQMAEDINATLSTGSRRLEILECNIAQFREVDDLGIALTRIASMNLQNKIPLVFFDEFDCEFEKNPQGWLKYFLAPMQDGTFYTSSHSNNFGRAIFVFAGGVYRTFNEFNPFAKVLDEAPVELSASDSDEAKAEKYEVLKAWREKNNQLPARREKFKEQKGPDFISRLRGHIDIISVNPDDTAQKVDGKRIKPVIRRALTLRGQIEAANLVVSHGDCKVASIDNDVLYALLTVDHYRHGVRSMEAILQMCTPLDGVIQKASLPSRAQLSMHVDADEFFVRVQRGRYCSSISVQTANSPMPPESEGSELLSSQGGQTLQDQAVRATGEPDLAADINQPTKSD